MSATSPTNTFDKEYGPKEASLETGVAHIENPPYPPSIADRITAAVESVPLPYVLTYLVLFLVESALIQLVGWLDGSSQWFVFEPIYLLFPLWTWGTLGIISFLDSAALDALRSFRPLYSGSKEEFSRLAYEFTTMPPRPVLLTSIFWVSWFVFLAFIYFSPIAEQFHFQTAVSVAILTAGLFSYAFGGSVWYHTIHQLRLVSRTLSKVERFNLFRLDPIYSFSKLTAKTGIAWLILLTITQFLFPAELGGPLVASTYIAATLLALAAFILPLWRVHQRLVEEKRALQARSSQRLEETAQRLHRSLEEDRLEEMPALQDALAGLVIERDAIAKIPTWPWRSETLRGVVTAFFLPVVLFLIQLIIERWILP